MRRRRVKHQTHRENIDRWMVSYADYMTLMFALFVVLYAMAIVNEGRYPQLLNTLEIATEPLTHKNSFTDADVAALHRKETSNTIFDEATFLGIADPNTKDPNQTLNQDGQPHLVENESGSVGRVGEMVAEDLGMPLQQIAQQFEMLLSDAIDSQRVVVEQDDDWVTIELDSQQIFPQASATILNQARVDLDRIIDTLRKINNFIRIRGYTDDNPIHNEIYDSNWELSIARAVGVLRYIEGHGVAPERLAVEGYGQYSPFQPNTTDDNRRANRKVVIALSKYEWQALTPITAEYMKPAESTKENELKADSNIILTIPLHGGGVRYTTRQD